MKKLKKYGMGGKVDITALSQMGKPVLDGILELLDGTPQASNQPIVNANTMRNMVNPYSFGNGGIVGKTKKIITGSNMESVNDKPDNLIQYRHPKVFTKEQSDKSQEQGMAVVKALDPTGITNYPDLYDAISNGDGIDILRETLASLPMIGKAGKLIKGLENTIKVGKRAVPLAKISRNYAATASTFLDFKKTYALGGTVDDLDEDELAQLQEFADAQGAEPQDVYEDWLATMQEEQPEEEEIPEEIPEEDEDGAVGQIYALGGKVGHRKIEVEDKEVLQTPSGQLAQVNGDTHEEGGETMNVPQGTKIYSDRLAVDGKTMQQRKQLREKTMTKLSKATDGFAATPLKNTIKRTSEINEKEEEKDMMLQNVANAIYGKQGEAGYGSDGNYYPWLPDELNLPITPSVMTPLKLGSRRPIQLSTSPTTTPMAAPTNLPSTPTITPNRMITNKPASITPAADESMGLGIGDYVGLAGNVLNAVAPIVNTRNAARATKPNINRYLGVGKEALDANEDAMDYVLAERDRADTDVDTATNTMFARNRNSARDVNTVRALDAVANMAKNKAKGANAVGAGRTMSGLFGQKGNIAMRAKQLEAAGQTAADTANAQDTDNYFTNMGANLTNLGTNVQGIGKSLNVARSNQDDMDLLALLTENNIKLTRGKNGRIKLTNNK